LLQLVLQLILQVLSHGSDNFFSLILM